MYYYILEQQKNKAQESLVNKIIATIEDLQIMGEAVKSNPVQKPDELAEIGLSKGYNTVVAIGSDSIINEIAPIVAKHRAVLGIVPTDPNSAFFNLIDCNSWQNACDLLAKRIVDNFDLGVIGKEKVFLSHIVIKPEKSGKQVLIKSIFKKSEVEGPAESVMVANSSLKNGRWEKHGFADGMLSINYKSFSEKNSGFWQKFLGSKESTYTSTFHAPFCHIGGLEKTLSVYSSDNQFICHTPVAVSVIPNAIKLIVSKKENKAVDSK
jgi:hypothetical protein